MVTGLILVPPTDARGVRDALTTLRKTRDPQCRRDENDAEVVIN